MRNRIGGSLVLLTAVLLRDEPLAQDGLDDTASREITLPPRPGMKKAGAERSFFFIGPKEKSTTPENGYGLLLVLPGGTGSRDFHPFVKRIYENALADDWVAAQLIAIPWARSKELVWPTRSNAPKGLGLATELFVEDVVTSVAGRVKLDPSRVLLLAWSSGGPAAYSISLESRKSVTGFYIAMSVFKPHELPSLKEARSEAYFLLHSPEDGVCPHRLAIDAEKRLKRSGARVRLETYEGGHGWRGDVYGLLREGFSWLEKNHATPDKRMWPKSRRRPRSRARG